MKNINEDLLNRYIDNDLSTNELEEINSLLKVNPDLVKELKAIKVIDQSLRSIEIEEAPLNITEKIMEQVLAAAHKVKPKGRAFIVSVTSFLSLIILSFFTTAFFLVTKNIKESSSSPITEKMNQQLDITVNVLNQFLNNRAVLVSGAIISILLLLFMYYAYESHKTFKHRLEGISKA